MQPEPIGIVLQRILDRHVNRDRMEVMVTAPRGPLPTALRWAVIQRDRFACLWCTARKPLEVDHIIPYSAGGSKVPTNLRTLCKPCNQDRSNRAADVLTASVADIVTDCHSCAGSRPNTFTREAFCIRCDRNTTSDQAALWRDLTWEQWRSEFPAHSRFLAHQWSVTR